jgi:hypothetical protein
MELAIKAKEEARLMFLEECQLKLEVMATRLSQAFKLSSYDLWTLQTQILLIRLGLLSARISEVMLVASGIPTHS